MTILEAGGLSGFSNSAREERRYLADLLGVNGRQTASEYGKVLAEDVRQSAVDLTVAGDHGIPRKLQLKIANFYSASV